MVVLALVIVCVWAVGGFELRQTYDDKSPGEALNLGPAEIALDHAIGYQFGDDVSIEVAGSCGLTADQSAGSVQYAIQDGAYAGMRTDGDPLISTESMLSLGTDDGLSFDTTRDVLSPGVPAIPCVLRFTLPPETMGQDEVTVLIAKLQFGEQGNVKNDAETSKTWNPAPDGYRVTFPISWTIR
ncbi:hypothetical protein [Propionimicrobium sp. PCR01-08-3]|uniref:hypothetical protein n=1 Tax=Propionimicrobium sp. PCR01-08-3 TaxID=3052086 RepID=UPI00255C83A7|nr:hypothetical protein [Propionimicrobium sp. PCR01-08-3]WIY82589.1 hypothetical protein QQ658_13975 [Propionimicrobium sp. PCR01-08-3]